MGHKGVGEEVEKEDVCGDRFWSDLGTISGSKNRVCSRSGDMLLSTRLYLTTVTRQVSSISLVIVNRYSRSRGA